MKRIFSLFLFSLLVYGASGQHVNIKTNLLYDATATINLGFEVGLGKRASLEISGNFNDWTIQDDKMWKHWMVQPEFRLWTCERFNGHFFGIHALGGQYETYHIKLPFDLFPGLNKYRYNSDFIGGGLSYGYQWIWGNHWGFEMSIGAGYLYTKYDQYKDLTDESFKGNHTKNYFGPTKAGISIIYFIH